MTHSTAPDVRTSTSASGLRVLFAHHSADIYGASRALVNLCEGLGAIGVEATVVLPERGPLETLLAHCVREIVVEDLPVIRRGAPGGASAAALLFRRPPGAVARLASLARDRRIDVIHTNTAVLPTPALSARRVGVPHVWHVRESFRAFPRLWPVYRRYVTGLSRFVVCPSTSVREQFAPGDDRVVVIPDAIDAAAFRVRDPRTRADFRALHSIAPDDLVFGIVGRLRPDVKGQDVALRAFARMERGRARVRLLLVGSPAPGHERDEEKLRSLAHELRVDQDVIFAGELADIRPAYAAMDVLLFPSVVHEAFGLVVAEAMSGGIPVVASATGGASDQIEDGRSGILVPPGDVAALASAMNRLAHHDTLRREIGRDASEAAVARSSGEPSRQMLELYRRAVERR